MEHPLPKSTPVDVDLPLSTGEKLRAGGSVIYTKATNGDATEISPGIAVKFDRLTESARASLAALVEELLVGDIDSSQTDPAAEPN